MLATIKKEAATAKAPIRAVDIIALAKSRCGIETQSRAMSDLIAGTLTVEGRVPRISLNEHLSEAYKRATTAIILDTVLQEGELINVIVEYSDGRLPEMTERARNLLMPEKLFRRAYEEKKSCGPLRPTLLAVIFQVPLTEVFKRIVDLDLYKG